ncbi:MAG: glutathione synthase [Woeseiaceae bacterium]|nr:glutathione synthase [Woeseiaceae bacterium]
MADKRRRLGIVMDPIESIVPRKDSSFAMLLEAQARGYDVVYFLQSDLRLRQGEALGRGRELAVRDQSEDWFALGDTLELPLAELDVILMRKDPPFDMEYIYTTYILERAELAGSLVVNKPQALRDMNEKMFTAWFPDCAPATLVTRSMADLKAFGKEHGTVVVKPLDGMGGKSIFVVRRGDNNANVIFETLTDNGRRFAMAQEFIAEISEGDKRILLVDGEALPVALARVPSADDNRGNLVMGATAEARELTDRDREICARIGPSLRERGVLFCGIDVIGDFLTEINSTSPTGIREIRRLFDLDASALMFDAIERKLG